jgi:hypothetical protein
MKPLEVANEAQKIVEHAVYTDTPIYQLRKTMREFCERVEIEDKADEIVRNTKMRYYYAGDSPVTLIGFGVIEPGQVVRIPAKLSEQVAKHPEFTPVKPRRIPKSKGLRVVCPYTNLRKETREALERYAPQVEFVDVSSDEQALWRLWKEVWADCQDTVFVEHDIVIHEGVIPAFENCKDVWCTFAYPYAFGNNDPYHGTGCVRFRAELMADFPDLWDIVGKMSGPHHPPGHWCSLDGYSQVTLWAAEYHSHQHDPACKHLDPGNSHGCLGQF